MRTATSLLLLLAVAGTASAAGFVLNDHGARATGRADAVVATVSDGSAIVHNVGGIAVKDGTAIYLGASLVVPDASFTPEGSTMTTDTDSPPAVTPQFYVTSRVHELVTVGVGFHTPFGSHMVWPEDAPTTDEVTEQTLRTYYITPAVGLNLGSVVPGLTLGAGLDLVPATVQLDQDVFFGTERGHVALGGDAFGVGGRAGVMWNPEFAPELNLGVAYRSPVKLDFEGTGDFDIGAPFRSQLPPDGDISTSITLPQSVSGGVAYRPIEDLEVELDAIWWDWSSFDKLEITLPDDSILVSEREYEDTLTVRFGVEYALRAQHLDLRAGYMYDPTPVPAEHLTASLPDIDRHDLTAGASYHFTPAYNVDLGALLVLPGSRETADTPFEPVHKGTYDVTALVVALSFGGRFGAGE